MKVVLQYLNGSNPTPAETAHKASLSSKGWTVRQRNGRMVGKDEKVETDGVHAVTGKVPPQYAKLKDLEIEVIDFDAAAAEKAATAAVNVDDMTAAEIKARLDELKVEYPGNAKKADLVALLKQAEAADVLK